MTRTGPVANRALSRAIPRVPEAPGPSVAAIVVAAGSSSRMGQHKPLMRLRGKPLLEYCLECVRASSAREIILVLGADADRTRHEIPLEGIRVVVNDGYREGMSSSIRVGLKAATPGAAAYLIVLGDQPFVTARTIDAMIARYDSTRAAAVVPTFRRTRGNPVLLDRSLAPEIESVRGDVGCRGVIAAHAAEVVEVPVDDPGVLLDVDTPEDLEAFENALRMGTPLERLVRR